MEHSEGFAYAYGYNFYYEHILGMCAKKGEGLVAKQRAWAWVLMIFGFIWLPQAATLFILAGNLNACIKCLSTNLTQAMLIAKIVILQYHRKAIGSILVTIAEDWLRVETKKDLDIMFETAKLGRLMSIISVFIVNIMFFVYIFFRIWLLMQKPDPNIDPRLVIGLLHDSYVPFDTTKLTIFVPIWIGQFFATFLSMVSYSGPDCLLSMVVLHMCGQLRMIRYSLKSIVNETTLQDTAEYWRKIAAIVKRHEHLNRLASVIRESFSTILLIQMLFCTVSFCLQCYVLFTIIMDGNRSPLDVLYMPFCVLYATDTLVHLFAYCYVGERLLIESTSIGDDFYMSAWYDLAPREANAFLFVRHRSNIPLEIKAGKFCTFNVQLFSSVMRTSMGYFSMLMVLKDRMID